MALLTSGAHRYPSRIPCRFEGKDWPVVADLLRTADREPLVKRPGVPQEMVAP